MAKKKNHTIVLAIVFGSLMLSGALVFLGFQFMAPAGATDIQARIDQAIQDYDAKISVREGRMPLVDVDSAKMAENQPFRGDQGAPLTLVEFSDYQCPYCEKFHNEAYPEIVKNYIETGKLKFVYRDFPLSSHPGAYPAALAADCARDQGGDDKYFAMHDKIFADQAALGASGANLRDVFLRYAQEIGIDTSTFASCYDSEKFKNEIISDRDTAISLGINATPSFVLGDQVFSGAQPFEVFQTGIEAALNPTQ